MRAAYAKLWDGIRSNRIVRFFYPKVMPGDVVSEIYVKSFRWTFFTVLALACLFYFVLQPGNPLVVDAMNFLGRGLSFITGRQSQAVEHPDVNALFIIILAVYGVVFFGKHMRRIPPDVCDLGAQGFLMLSTFIFFFPTGGLVIRIGKLFEAHPDFGLANFVFLLLFSFIYGFMSVNFVRLLLVVSVLGGWRITNRSIFNPERNLSRKRKDK